MPIFVSVLLISSAAVWLIFHRYVRRRLHDLKNQLPAAYNAALATSAEDDAKNQLVLLSIDLRRKSFCTVPFEQLTPAEQRLALHAYAVETLPRWMLGFTTRYLPRAERDLIVKLRQIKTSQPNHPKVHFGAIRSQQRLRSTPEA